MVWNLDNIIKAAMNEQTNMTVAHFIYNTSHDLSDLCSKHKYSSREFHFQLRHFVLYPRERYRFHVIVRDHDSSQHVAIPQQKRVHLILHTISLISNVTRWKTRSKVGVDYLEHLNFA